MMINLDVGCPSIEVTAANIFCFISGDSEVTLNWCMVEWCTQDLRRDGSSFS